MNWPIIRYLLCAVVLNMAATFSVTTSSPSQTFAPSEGFIPDRTTALLVAQAILDPLSRQPGRLPVEDLTCTTKLDAETWHITCTPKNPLTKGGGVYMDISKKDGRVIYFEFYK